MNRQLGLRITEAVLVVLSVASLCAAALVVAGPVGASLVSNVPEPIHRQLSQTWPEGFRAPGAPVDIKPSHEDDSYEAFNQMPREGGLVPPGWAEFSGGRLDTVGRQGFVSFWDPGPARRAVWVVLVIMVPLGLALLWFTLARMVRTARTGDPFTLGNARRLRLLGLLLIIGPVTIGALRLLVLNWMLSGSTAAGKAALQVHWQMFAVWPVAVGLCLLALAAVWRRGVAMRDDLEGLV